MNNWIRILVGIVVLAHGVGHVLFLMPALGAAQWGQSTRSWLLTGTLGESLTRGLGAILWLAVTLAYIAGVIGMFMHAAWWQPTLVAASVVSAAGLILFWSNPPSSPALSALIFDLCVIVAVQFFRWPQV